MDPQCDPQGWDAAASNSAKIATRNDDSSDNEASQAMMYEDPQNFNRPQDSDPQTSAALMHMAAAKSGGGHRSGKGGSPYRSASSSSSSKSWQDGADEIGSTSN